jgi:hypothetical protein
MGSKDDEEQAARQAAATASTRTGRMAAATFTRPGRPMPVKSRAPVRCRASYQRVGGGGGGGGGVCAGSGNGDAAGAAPFGGFGFFGFGRIIFRAGFGGGPAG